MSGCRRCSADPARQHPLALPIVEDRNAWLKDWGKRLRASLAVSECGPGDGKIQHLLNELEKLETLAAPDTPNEVRRRQQALARCRRL
jgi:hypothetical protein